MQRVSTGGPDHVCSRLEVSGEPQCLYEFVNAAAGPGFLDWEIDWYGAFDEAFGRSLIGGAPSLGAAAAVGHKLTDRSWHRVGAARRAAELDPRRCPFDLGALIPVPDAVLRRGYRGAGEAWLWQHWGVGAPLRHVTLEIVQRPFQQKLPALAAVYRFLSEDWAPALAIGRIRESWPSLCFELACRFPDDVAHAETLGAAAVSSRVETGLGEQTSRHRWPTSDHAAAHSIWLGTPKRRRRHESHSAGKAEPRLGLGGRADA